MGRGEGRGPGGFLRSALVAALLLAGCFPGPEPGPVPVQPALVDDAVAARLHLETQRTEARLAGGGATSARILRLVELGLFEDADSLLAGAASLTPDLAAAEAELRFRQHRFAEARELVASILEARPRHRAARLLSIRLALQAWQLEWAPEQAEALLARGRRDPVAAALLGRIRLLQGDPPEAIEWARRARQWDPSSARAYLLEAEAHLVEDRLPEAESMLRRSLELAPLDADARFAYGYLLWRRSAAALLPAMAAQWKLALQVDPLHLRTHWHQGNGYTPLDFRAYASLASPAVRAALAPVDTLIARGRLEDAIAETRRLEADLAESVLPALYRGSTWYLLSERNGAAALDSAQLAFRTILADAPDFGPAHNGIAAVLARRQTMALARYDSLESAIALEPAGLPPHLPTVFPELRSYGERVARMVAQQLGPAAAYLPLLERLGVRYHILPLHQDLAAATGQAAFRVSVTPDHRRWMDVRAAGGEGVAAVGIEAIEAGSHQGRNVLLHEFAHLAHAHLFTEEQRQRVRELYQDALQEDRLLDHYAGTDEREFLAQAIEAYASVEKVHPINPKGLNTREELRREDPDTFAFVEGLFAELERSLSGDPSALRSNRAQMYVDLARRTRVAEGGTELVSAAALLDSALVWDPAYLPAMVEYAAVEAARGRPARAEAWLDNAEGIAPGYPPVLAARAEILREREHGMASTFESRAALLRRAGEAEEDLLLRGRYTRDLWELYDRNGRVADAIAIADGYAASGSTVTPPLRALREEAVAAAMRMRLRSGYAEEVLPYFRQRVSESPLDRDARLAYAEALRLAGMESEASAILAESRDLLAAAGAVDPRISLPLAEMRIAAGDTAAASALVAPLLDRRDAGPGRVDGTLVRLLISLGQRTEAQRQLALLPEAKEPSERAEVFFTRAWIELWRGDIEQAEELLFEAIGSDPYHLEARLALYRLLRDAGRSMEAEAVAEAGRVLPLPLGPAFEAALAG